MADADDSQVEGDVGDVVRVVPHLRHRLFRQYSSMISSGVAVEPCVQLCAVAPCAKRLMIVCAAFRHMCVPQLGD